MMAVTLLPAPPAQVSRILREAGLAKAGRYTPWGYLDTEGSVQDGFIVKRHTEWQRTGTSRRGTPIGEKVHTETRVLCALKGAAREAFFAKAAEALGEAGYEVVTLLFNLTVWRP